jgi:ribosome-associated toxin RatA of RatAB toxin-antitoxin module
MTARSILPVALALASASPVLADDWQRKLAGGEILVYSTAVAGELELKAVIEAAPRRVWELVSRCDRYAQTMARVKAARLISRKGQEVICEVTVDMPFPLSDLTAVTRAIHEERGDRFARRWQLLRGDYRVNRGSWELAPFAGNARRTLVVYRVHAVPKVSLPRWVTVAAQRRSLPDMIKRLRTLAGASK